MSEQGTLMIRVDKYLEGETIAQAVPVRLRRMRRSQDGPPWQMEVVAAPATLQDRWCILRVPPGTYQCDTTLPSGEHLIEKVRVRSGRKSRVILRGQHSPNEWRSWAHFSGARDASPTAARLSPSYDLRGLGRFDYKVSVGTHPKAGGKFDIDSWSGWATYLNRRWDETEVPGYRPSELELAGDLPVGFHEQPGGPGEPTLIRIGASELPDFSAAAIGRDRPFIAISSALGTRIISIPWPWRTADHLLAPFLELLLSATKDELLCAPVVRDDHLGGLMAYLSAGRMALAGELLSVAHDALFAKYDNPLGAAAGGYVLLSTDASERLKEWPHWLHNLATNFPNLPDGPILRAKWLRDHGKKSDAKEADDWLREGFRRGIPFFTAGITWLIEGYQRLAATDDEAAINLQQLRTVARSIDLTSGVTSFRLTARDPTQIRLRLRYFRNPANLIPMPAAMG